MKPKIICHIMSSIDGRLLDERWTDPFGGMSKAELLKMYAIIGRCRSAYSCLPRFLWYARMP